MSAGMPMPLSRRRFPAGGIAGGDPQRRRNSIGTIARPFHGREAVAEDVQGTL
jgi:hypothetical protein